MSFSSRKLALGLVAALALFSSPVNAVVVPVPGPMNPGDEAFPVSPGIYTLNPTPASFPAGNFEHIYKFTVVAGQYVTTSITNAVPPNPLFGARIEDLFVGWGPAGPVGTGAALDASIAGPNSVQYTNGSGNTIGAAGDLVYVLSAGSHYLHVLGEKFGEATYNVNVVVAETPIPPALVLFGSALAGIGLLARRRRKMPALAA